MVIGKGGELVEAMIAPSVSYWLWVGLLLVNVIDLSSQRHGIASAVGEFQPAPALPSDDVYKRRFMFGRRSADDDLWERETRRSPSRRRFKFGKKFDPLMTAAEKHEFIDQRWPADYSTVEDKRRMFKFGKRN